MYQENYWKNDKDDLQVDGVSLCFRNESDLKRFKKLDCVVVFQNRNPNNT